MPLRVAAICGLIGSPAFVEPLRLAQATQLRRARPDPAFADDPFHEPPAGSDVDDLFERGVHGVDDRLGAENVAGLRDLPAVKAQ